MKQSQGVMFLAELQNQGLAENCAELASAGLKIAGQLGEELSAVLIGTGIAESAQELIGLGVKKVYVVDNPDLTYYHSESYLTVMTRICQDISPKVFLLGHTVLGRDLGTRLAFRMNTGLIPNCVDLEGDPDTGLVQMTRPIYGGKAHGIYTIESGRMQMATVAPKIFEPTPRDDSRQGEIISYTHEVDGASLKLQVVERFEDSVEGVKLEAADVIVSGGRGVGSAEDFEVLKELAKLLGGCVGASRAAVDSGWMHSNLQVGLTGKLVTPNVYIAIGISGALQHMAGCSRAKTIIAINLDHEAPIFKMAHFGVVGDWREILPPLLERYRALRC